MLVDIDSDPQTYILCLDDIPYIGCSVIITHTSNISWVAQPLELPHAGDQTQVMSLR